MLSSRVLIVDDELNFREFLGEALEAHDYEVDLAATARAGLATARQRLPHVVLLDQNLPDRPGLEMLPELKRLPSNPVIIVLTAYADYSRAVDAVKAGAFHYIAKPFEFADLLRTLSEACVGVGSGEAAGEPAALADFRGSAPSIEALKQQVARVARSPVGTVLLQGESGTGKELLARAIHSLSPRAGHRLVTVNCAALTESLLMSELFGHERGAFTDAREQKKGLFEAADGGTLFLDEVSETGPHAQAALLRVLEQRTLTRVGGTREVSVDLRIVAATNRSLAREVAAGAFRADLYYRLNLVQLTVPPLRERGADVLLLARYFSASVAARYGVSPLPLSPEAEARLLSYSWPGNVRELRNAIERAYVIGSAPAITPRELSCEPEADAAVGAGSVLAGTEGVGFQEAKQRVVDRFERAYLEALLARTGGNVTRAAEEAGVLRQVFQRLLKRHDLDRDLFHGPTLPLP